MYFKSQEFLIKITNLKQLVKKYKRFFRKVRVRHYCYCLNSLQNKLNFFFALQLHNRITYCHYYYVVVVVVVVYVKCTYILNVYYRVLNKTNISVLYLLSTDRPTDRPNDWNNNNNIKLRNDLIILTQKHTHVVRQESILIILSHQESEIYPVLPLMYTYGRDSIGKEWDLFR